MARRDDEVRRARELLLHRGLHATALPPSLVHEEIEQSWRRSVSLRVDPTAEPRVLGTVDPDATVLRAADRVLDQWQGNLADSRLALFVADHRGRIVSRRIIAPQDEGRLDRANAAEGFDFSEGSLGTNGLGTPIEARGVVFVRGHEHYNEALSQLACAGVPLRHPITGRIVGSLALAAPASEANPLMVAMVRQAGQQIAEQLASQADSRDLELARTYQRFRSSRRAVLVMNAETVMTDLPTLSHLDTETHAVLWDRLMRMGRKEEPFLLDLPSLGTMATAHQLGRPPQDPLFVLEFTEPIALPVSLPGDVAAAPQPEGVALDGRGDPSGTAGIRHPAAEPAAAASPFAPKPPGTPTGPYAAVRQALTDASGWPVVSLTGAAGTGKVHQARAWLRDHTAREPLVLDAGRPASPGDGHAPGPSAAASPDTVRSPARAWTGQDWETMEQALAEGRGVVVAGVDALDPAARSQLRDVASAARASGAGVPVLCTERGGDPVRTPAASAGHGGHNGLSGTASSPGAEADGPAATGRVRVPPLAELSGELPVVIREVAADLFPGAPPVRFAPAALQALLAWAWPGNVAELRSVLAELPAEARAGVVQIQQLPPELRRSAGPRLSRFEHAERETIVTVLREVDWNKSLAAQILGIGRTTLYRKIRSLRIHEGD